MTARVLSAANAAMSLAVMVAAYLRTGEAWGVVAWSGYPIVGWYLLQVRPGNRIGWVMLGIGGCWALAIASIGTSWLPLALLGSAGAYLGFVLFLGLVLLFPTGAVTTGLGRVGVILTAAVAVLVLFLSLVRPTVGEPEVRNPLAVDALGPFAEPFLDDQGFLVVVAIAVLAGIDAVRRWRRSAGVERLQLRWFAWALCLVVVGFALWSFEPTSPWLETPLMFVPNLIPVAVGIAISRHGLYGIDRVVSRTVSYVLVSLVVVGTYALVVTSVSRLLPESGALPVAGATLAAAGVCLPVLRRVRGAVDRRFDRARFDAQREVDAFASRMSVAAEADAVTDDLAGTVQRTLAPSGVGVWVGGTR